MPRRFAPPPGQTPSVSTRGPKRSPEARAVATKEIIAADLIHAPDRNLARRRIGYQAASSDLFIDTRATPATDKPLVEDYPSALALPDLGGTPWHGHQNRRGTHERAAVKDHGSWSAAS